MFMHLASRREDVERRDLPVVGSREEGAVRSVPPKTHARSRRRGGGLVSHPRRPVVALTS